MRLVASAVLSGLLHFILERDIGMANVSPSKLEHPSLKTIHVCISLHIYQNSVTLLRPTENPQQTKKQTFGCVLWSRTSPTGYEPAVRNRHTQPR